MAGDNERDLQANAGSAAADGEGAASNGGAENAVTPGVFITLGAAAYARIAHLANAIPEAELQRVNADLNALSVTGIGAWPKIKSARADVLRKNPTHDMTLFDAFEDIVISLGHVEAQVDATEEENRVLAGLADAIKLQLNDLKDLLEQSATARR